MEPLTIAEMWQDLVEFDPSIQVVYHTNTRKTTVENKYFEFSSADHIDAAIHAAWIILISNED